MPAAAAGVAVAAGAVAPPPRLSLSFAAVGDRSPRPPPPSLHHHPYLLRPVAVPAAGSCAGESKDGSIRLVLSLLGLEHRALFAWIGRDGVRGRGAL